MRLCVLYTGGKDSTYALHHAIVSGHEVLCISAVQPASEDSMLFHAPGIKYLKFYENAFGIPSYVMSGSGREESDLEELLVRLKRDFEIDGVAVGAIDSDYQFIRFSSILRRNGLKLYAPLWRKDQEEYMRRLPREGFHYIITKISTYGLPLEFMGREVDMEMTEKIIQLSRKFGFNPAFEGGEAETMVIDAPLMKCRMELQGNIVRVSMFEGYYSIYYINCLNKRI
ncbi:MAG: diphthine--ammonia ligase [Fervidicoccaceae archaeon]